MALAVLGLQSPARGAAMDSDIAEAIHHQVLAALWECCPRSFIDRLHHEGMLCRMKAPIAEDVLAFALKDPAACQSPMLVLTGYTSFRALLHYRMAHTVFEQLPNDPEAATYCALISSRGQWLSGADIHHRSRIGKRLVLDHAVGTVIGETCVIGDDAYILGGVTLGAAGIANNPATARHPLLGDRVQVGAFARILGRVTIGDDVFIGPHCTITQDVPANTRITLQSTVQTQRKGPRHEVPAQNPQALL